MNKTLKPARWRICAVKMTVLLLVWTTLATLFAAQFYWMGKNGPLRISWTQAFLRSFTEWCPWLILSPLAVWLAESFRFDRARWLSGVLPHLPACVLVALAYNAISVLLTGNTRIVEFRNGPANVRVVSIGSGAVGVLGSGTNFPPGPRPPRALVQRLNTGSGNPGEGGLAFGFGPGIGDGGFAIHAQHSPGAGHSSTGALSIGTVRLTSPFAPAVSELTPPFRPGMPGPWTRFLHLAAARAQTTIPIYWAIVCVTWVVSYYQQLRERERRTLELEARLTQAKLQTLKTQLQPHFLFNTLNAIASLVRKRPDAAEDMIGSLSDFLRLNLDVAQKHEVPLRQELEFLDLYLEIQQVRFGDRLRIQKDIAPATLDVVVPTLILQPLVENSVRHGIEPREAGGTILIRATRHGDLLRLDVRDDGEGFKGGQLAALREGIGLSNTKARLQELYGHAHRLQITPNVDGGLTATVEVPWRESATQPGLC